MFRTLFDIHEAKEKINIEDDILFIGSCFTENIGKKLSENKFSTTINPFGILYNPESIAQGIRRMLSEDEFNKDDLFEQGGVWNSFMHHSRFSGTDKNKVLETINYKLKIGKEAIKESKFLFITFGTAWVYQLKESGEVVSNCHKLPANHFNRFKLSVNNIVEAYRSLINELQKLNENFQIAFTVSPIRHMKDGAMENQVSKSTLILAANELAEEFKNVSYFPAYEIMMDDLRDYRFYANDMVHPSTVAVNYIWEKFRASWISNAADQFMAQMEKINRAMQHKPFQPKATSHQAFVKKQIELITRLSAKYPKADFTTELAYFEESLV